MSSRFLRSYWGPSDNSTGLCKNCSIRPKFQNYDYCGKACAADAETRRNPAAQAISAQGPPTSVARQSPFSYSSPPGPNAPAASNMCENCRLRVKSQEPDEDGTVITHLYCGIRCYQASQQTPWPASTIPAPAAAFAHHEPLKLCVERTNTLMGRQISLMMQERWKSDKLHIPKLKAIYRIDTPGQVSRRFDLALQMNNGCPVTTTYYGAIATCSIADDTDPAPCASESCDLCDALRSSFGNLLYGASCGDGAYGPGLYTYSNPALAYHAIVHGDGLQVQGSNCALIQCRVVTKTDSVPSPNSYAGFMDDSGVVFCAQPTAIIPTHLLTYNATIPPKAIQPAIPINANPVSLGSTPSAVNPSPFTRGIGQVSSSNTEETKLEPVKDGKRKGKAHVKAPLQKPRGTSSGSAISLNQRPAVDLTESASSERSANLPNSRGKRLPTASGWAIPGSSQANTTITPQERDNSSRGYPQSTPLPPSPAPTPASRSGFTYQSAAQEKAQLAVAYQGALTSARSNARVIPSAVNPAVGGDPQTTPLVGTHKPRRCLHLRHLHRRPGPASPTNRRPKRHNLAGAYQGALTSARSNARVIPSGVNPAVGGDPQTTPLPPSPAPTPASRSGFTYQSAAQEKAQFAGAYQGALTSARSNARVIPSAVNPAVGGDPQSTPLPPSPAPTPASRSGFTYQSAIQEKAQLAAANHGVLAPACNAWPTSSTVNPAAEDPQSIRGYTVPTTAQESGCLAVSYPPIPFSTFTSGSTANLIKRFRAKSYPLTGHADLDSRMDIDDDDFNLKPDENLAKRQEQQDRFDEDDETDFDDLPDHPPSYYYPSLRR